MKPKIKTALLLAVAGILFTHIAIGQDAHYWQSEYNPGGFLMAEAAIAYNQDSGLFYYNPALLPLHPKNSVSVSGNIYNLKYTHIKDATGRHKPLNSLEYHIIPQLVSRTKILNSKVVAGYGLSYDEVTDFSANQKETKEKQILDDSYSPGKETFIGQYSVSNKISLTSGLASIGVKLNDQWAIGLSAVGMLRTQNYLEDYKSRAVINDTARAYPAISAISSTYEMDYTHVGILFRTGVSYEKGRHHLGLLLSSPLWSIKGWANLQSDFFISNLRIPGTDINRNFMASYLQNNFKAYYKSPLHIALGYAMDYRKGQVYVAAEHFFKVNRYNIIHPGNESFILPDTGSAKEFAASLLQFKDQHKSVTNFALGISYHLNPVWTGYAAFRTDFSYAAPRPKKYNGQLPYITTWDMYHLAVGGNLKRRKMNIRAGLLLEYGSSPKVLQPINFDDPDESNLLLGDPHYVRGSLFSAGFLLTFIHLL